MDRRAARIGTAAFVLVGPLLELLVGPLVVTGGFAAGDAWADATWLRSLGGAVVLLALLVLPACLRAVADDGLGTPSPAAPTRRLVVRGPYRVVRHPMYAVTAAGIAGEGLLLSRPVLLVAAAAYLAALGLLVRLREEPALRRRFGPAWDAYAARVPALVPRPRRAG